MSNFNNMKLVLNSKKMRQLCTPSPPLQTKLKMQSIYLHELDSCRDKMQPSSVNSEHPCLLATYIGVSLFVDSIRLWFQSASCICLQLAGTLRLKVPASRS